jgi:hypothetical protein
LADIILVLCDSFYNDIKASHDLLLKADEINTYIENVKEKKRGFNPLYVTGPGLFGQYYNSKNCNLVYDGNCIYRKNGKVILRKYDSYDNDRYSNNRKSYDYDWRINNIFK